MHNKDIKLILLDEAVSAQQLAALESKLDKVFKAIGIDVDLSKRHFLDRVNDKRNKKPITIKELSSIFKKTLKKFGAKFASMTSRELQAVIKDIASDINIPFVLVPDPKEGDVNLIPKTIMRKQDFKTSNPVFATEGKSIKSVEMEFMPAWVKSGRAKDFTVDHVSKGIRIFFMNGDDLVLIKKNSTRPLYFKTEIEANEYLKSIGVNKHLRVADFR